jgi:flagellar basal-body rod modification protein FlgD
MTPTVNSSTSANSSAAAPAATTSATTGFGDNFDTFLKLLTTQLQNQDPTSPLDTNQFTAQLVSFSQVEQAINQNQKLATLVSLQTSNQLITALPAVGRTVEFSGDRTTIEAGGSAGFSYTLDNQSASTVLTVLDSNGIPVWRGAGSTGSGQHQFTWDGKSSTGAAMPAGTYQLAVTATAVDGSAVKVTQTATGKVSSVEAQNGSAVLDIGGYQVPMSNLISVRDSGV